MVKGVNAEDSRIGLELVRRFQQIRIALGRDVVVSVHLRQVDSKIKIYLLGVSSAIVNQSEYSDVDDSSPTINIRGGEYIG